MIDMASALTTFLRADTDLMTAAGSAVHADMTPEGVTYPFVLVRSVDVVEAAPPVSMWERHELQIDVVGTQDGFAALIAVVGLVRDRVREFHGAVSGLAVAGTDVVSTTRTVDESVSPARPRWVLAVEVTARDI